MPGVIDVFHLRTSMTRPYALAFLNLHRCTAPEAVQVAARAGADFIGLRPWQNVPGSPYQRLIGEPSLLRETQAAMRDTGVRVFDLEIIRIDAGFDAHRWDALYEVGAALGAKAVTVAGDDADEARLCDHYAQLCEAMAPFGLTADLEFTPWTAVPDARTALRVIERAGAPANAGILPDPLHVARSHTTLQDLRDIPRHLLHYLQICDGEPGLHFTTEQLIHTARCERLLPGEGRIDLRGYLQALPADLPLSCEVVHLERERAIGPADWAAQCLAATRRVAEGV
jgi:sugar phosphate isomerase/epimerase